MKKVFALFLASLVVVALAACGKKTTTAKGTQGSDATTTTGASTEITYEDVLGEFAKYYEQAASAKTVSERFALMAIAEAKLLESGVMIPMQANGGNFAISKVAPYTVDYSLWGNDEYRYATAIVADKAISNTDRNALKALWGEKKGTGTYLAEVKAYLAEKGYGIQDSYSLGYTSEPETYDVFLSSNAADAEVLVNLYDGLLEYNCEGVQVPRIATALPTVSEDGLTYTFTIRQGVKWFDSQGTYLEEDVTASDFVAGFQHMLDDPEGGLSWLVEGVIENASEYIAGEAEMEAVGVKAIDDYTLEYTLCQPTSYFLTMFSYGIFSPLCESYYKAQGGVLGEIAEDCEYGIDYNHIAYCGPYLVNAHVEKNMWEFKVNEGYWDKDNVNVKTIKWVYNDGQDPLQAYNDFKAGTIDGCGLNTTAYEKAAEAEADYIYVSSIDTSSYPVWLNVHRTGYANYNDATKLVSKLTEADIERTNAASAIAEFRMAIALAFDRSAYMAATVGETLKFNAMVNSYTPGNFVSLSEETTVKINGTDKTYPAGTFYGEIMQDQITADGYPMMVWNKDMEGGIGASSGFDGWYNPTEAVKYLNLAIAKLEEAGVEVTAENPIKLEVPYQDDGDYQSARVQGLKASIEASLGGKVEIVLNATTSRAELLYACYYGSNAEAMNYNIGLVSGWGPDYGDPSTYLDTMAYPGGYMLKCFGID